MEMTNRTDTSGAGAGDVRRTSLARSPWLSEHATDTARLVSRTGALAFTVGLGIAVATNAGAALADTDSTSTPTDSSAHSNSTSSTGPAGTGSAGSRNATVRVSGGKAVGARPPGQGKPNRAERRAAAAAATSASSDVPTASKAADVEPSETRTLGTAQFAPQAANSLRIQAPEVDPVILHPVMATAGAVSVTAKPAAMTMSSALSAALGANTPLAPASDLTMGSLLAWARREFERTFLNQNPVIHYDASANSQDPGGVITGNLNVTDAEGDPVSYALTKGPGNGTVTVRTDGTFTYTASAALASTGGTDSFTVTVSDAVGPFHVHGLAGLVGGQPANGTTMQINVSVAAPQAGVTVTRDAGVNRLDIIVNKSYAELRSQFEAAAPALSQQVLALVMAGQPNPDALIAATNANAPYGFIRYGAPLEYSLILNVLGFPPEQRQTVQYLMGNHMIATGMYVHDQSSQLYAPLKVTIYADIEGKTHFVIDQPGTRFDSFGNPVIEATGILLDGKLAGLLTALGAPVPNQLLHPSAEPAPAAPASAPAPTAGSLDPISGLPASVRRGLARTFLNQNPVIHYDASANSQGTGGVITGNLNVTDAEGDPVSYALTKGPSNGTVTVGTDGTFTYTASAALASTGGTDSFTVTVNDAVGPFHVHGLAGLVGGQPANGTTMQINVSVAAPQAGVTVTRDDVNRLDIIVPGSYSDVRTAFEAAAPALSQQVLALVMAGQPNPDALIAATNANAPYGFIRYGAPLEYSLILNVLGFPPEQRQTVQYLMGNHMIATGMYVHDQSSQLYAPLKVTIYADLEGQTHFVIDQPGTRFNSFDNPVIEATGLLLDGKLASLLTAMGAPVPDQLLHPSP